MAPAILHPAPLLGGLTNQVYSMIGLVLIANLTGAPLVLPHMLSHVTGGHLLPMSHLFDVERLASALSLAGVQLLRSAPTHGSAWRPLTPLAPLNCYLNYLSLRRRGCLSPHALENIVYQSLHPTSAIVEAVDAERRRLGESYGCLHPRIERDMLANWRFTEAASPPPRLAVTLRHMARVPELTRARRIFVAVGHVADADDARILTRRTSWGASLVRRRSAAVPEASFSGAWAAHGAPSNATSTSYAAAALADFEICRRAAWFVGWCGSTFTNWIARHRAQDGRPEWFNSCPDDPPGLTRQRDGGLYVDLCPAKLNRSAARAQSTTKGSSSTGSCPATPVAGDHRVLIARMKRVRVQLGGSP